jgi:CBS domain containing-hemolysin-like protein
MIRPGPTSGPDGVEDILGSLPLILVLPVLLVLSAIASGSETALFGLSHRERAELRRTAPTAWAAVESLLREPRRLLLFVLLLNMLVNVSYFVISSVLTTRMETGLGAAAVGVGSVLAVVLFGEILAKVVASAGRRWFCVVIAPPLAAVQVLLSPAVDGLDRLVLSPLIRVLRPHRAEGDRLRADELLRLVATGAGGLNAGERRLLGEVIELGQIRVREVMRPRDRIVSAPANASAGQIIETARAHRVTVLVLREGRTLDDGIAGFLHVKRYLAALRPGGPDPDPALFTTPPLCVPERARLDSALETLRASGRGEALCVDERGAIVGEIGVPDIVDELLAGMGEQRSGERHTIRLVGLGRWEASARLSVRDWAQYFQVPEASLGAGGARASTVGGLVMERLGRVPMAGDSVDFGPVRVRVASVVGRRVLGVLIELADQPRATPDTGDSGGAR